MAHPRRQSRIIRWRRSYPMSRHGNRQERRRAFHAQIVGALEALASQLAPEELRQVIWAYHTTCAEVIQRFEGHIAQHLGDGLLVYLEYPQAQEDGAQRAIRAGLGIVEAMGKLNARLGRDKRIRLTIRVGIHTGLVVGGIWAVVVGRSG